MWSGCGWVLHVVCVWVCVVGVACGNGTHACVWVNHEEGQWRLVCPERVRDEKPLCEVFGVRAGRDEECWGYLRERLGEASSGKWVAGWGRGDTHVQVGACLKGRTVYLVGSSHMRTMVLDLLKGMTGREQDMHIASRDRGCTGLDGFDIKGCGWPQSKVWEMEGGRVVSEEKYVEPRRLFEDGLSGDAWRLVFQFKTFVDTPELDDMIVRQLNGYKASVVVIEVGIWGWLAYEGGGGLDEQARRFLEKIRSGYDGTIVLVVDGYNYGHVGPHIVNGSTIAPVLVRVAQELKDILVFDRTESLVAAGKVERLRESMERHGYAGTVSREHARMLFSFLCTGY